MSIRAKLIPHQLVFNFNMRTSRGSMKDKTSWFIKLWDEATPENFGMGECGPLPGLSIDHSPQLESVLTGLVDMINLRDFSASDLPTALQDFQTFFASQFPLISFPAYPSVTFALETAILDLINGGQRVIFPNDFMKSRRIPINGLIWMGGLDFMLQQVEIKIRDGFKCVKLKIGGIDFEKECDVLQYIRRKYFREDIVIRLDANGALKGDEVIHKLNQLNRYTIHSIEQPVKPGSPLLAELCAKSPIPVALDESLIGIHSIDERISLLETVKPQFIILKPSLHGGLQSCIDWIKLAEERNIGWWITSALESNVGLNAIAQFTAQYPITLPQGLGTGTIYTNNIESPLTVSKGELHFDSTLSWDFSPIGEVSQPLN